MPDEWIRQWVDPTLREVAARVARVDELVRRPVERMRRTLVAGADLEGHDVTIEAEGFGASLLQHEIVPLDGILTLDRAEPDERRRAIAAPLTPRTAAA